MKEGEKLYEELFTNEEAKRAYLYNNYIYVFLKLALRLFKYRKIKLN